MDIKEEILAQMDSALRPEFDKAIDNTIEGAFKEDVKTLGFMVANSIKCQWEVMKPHLFYSYCLGVKAQEAKAQAVPDLGELQERIAGHQYYHDERGHMIVDMDDVVKEISGFDSWKAQAVPEWISVKDNLPPANILVLGMSQTRSNIFNIYNVMALDEFEEADVTHWMPLPDAPQEPAND